MGEFAGCVVLVLASHSQSAFELRVSQLILGGEDKQHQIVQACHTPADSVGASRSCCRSGSLMVLGWARRVSS